MRNFILLLTLAGTVALGACKKTGEGQYEVQKPVVESEADTVSSPQDSGPVPRFPRPVQGDSGPVPKFGGTQADTGRLQRDTTTKE